MRTSAKLYTTLSLLAGIVIGALGWHFASPHLTKLARESVGEHESNAAGTNDAKRDGNGHTRNKLDSEPDHARVRLSPSAMRMAEIEIATAGGASLRRTIDLPGEIELNTDRTSYIHAALAGLVREVTKSQGDAVTSGELLVVMESRELAEAKAAYLAAKERLALADANYKSAEDLRNRDILPDLEFRSASANRSEAQIELRASEYKLRALGLNQEQIASVTDQADDLATYEIHSPLTGTIIRRDVSVGEAVTSDAELLVVADLSTVWVRIGVFAQDLEQVHIGTPCTIVIGGQITNCSASISYLSPLVDAATRVAIARAVVPNTNGAWRPGAFVTTSLQVGEEPVSMAVPTPAIQIIENEAVVFVEVSAGEFELQPVETGRSDGKLTEIIGGLEAGTSYVAANAFMLKAELGKGADDDD